MHSIFFLFIIIISALTAAIEDDDVLILKSIDGRQCSVKHLTEIASGMPPISLHAKVHLRYNADAGGECIEKNIPVEWIFSSLGNSVLISHPNETWNFDQILIYPELPESMYLKLGMQTGEILFFEINLCDEFKEVSLEEARYIDYLVFKAERGITMVRQLGESITRKKILMLHVLNNQTGQLNEAFQITKM